MLFVDDRENPKVSNQVLMALGDNKLNPSGQARLERLPVGDYTILLWVMVGQELSMPSLLI